MSPGAAEATAQQGAAARDIARRVGVTTPALCYHDLVHCLVRYTAGSGKLSHFDAEIRSLSPQHRRSYSAKRAQLEGRLLSLVIARPMAGRRDGRAHFLAAGRSFSCGTGRSIRKEERSWTGSTRRH